MKKKTSVQTDVDTGSILRDEYDFSKGVRGKHFRAMASGYTVTIRNSDGTSVVKEVMPTDRTVVLSSDVWEYFPNSDAVNSALRSLISLIPAKRHTSKKILPIKKESKDAHGLRRRAFSKNWRFWWKT